MALIRNLTERGNSLGLIIPSQIGELLGWKAGQAIEFELVGSDRVILKPAKK